MRALQVRVTTWVNATFEPLLDRFVEVGLVQSAIVLAAQTFMALFPLLIAVIAIAPSDVANSIADTLRDRIGLSGSTDQSVHQLVRTRSQLQGTATVFGVLLVVASATSFTRALQRVYQNAWQLPKLGLKGSVRGLVWLVGLLAYFTLAAGAIKLTNAAGPAASPLRWAFSVASSLAIWWWTPFLLLGGRVKGRALLPGAVLTAAAVIVLGWVSEVYLPRAISSQERLYGTIGTVFAIESWLVVVAGAIVVAAVAGAVGAQYPGLIGRLIRGTAEVDGWRREPRPLRELTRRHAAEQGDADRAETERADDERADADRSGADRAGRRGQADTRPGGPAGTPPGERTGADEPAGAGPDS